MNKQNGLNKQANVKSFFKYLEYITNTHTADAPIWGRPNIEGRMICDKYKVELRVYSIDEDSQKVTVTKITAHDDDPEVYIQDVNLDQLKVENSKKKYTSIKLYEAFCALLSGISEDITESQTVSNEEIFGEATEVPAFDQPKQEVQYNTKTSSAAISQDHTDKEIPFPRQQEQKTQQKSSASEPVHTDTVITISHQQRQKNTTGGNTKEINQ